MSELRVFLQNQILMTLKYFLYLLSIANDGRKNDKINLQS